MTGGMAALAGARVDELGHRPAAKVTADDAMWKVVEQMKTLGRGAVLVEEVGALAGIFTERDLLNRVDYTDQLWPHLIVRRDDAASDGDPAG